MIEFTFDGLIFRSYDNLYSVSSSGRVLRRFLYAKITNAGGYSYAGGRLVHRMVAFCWVDNPEEARCVHHKNEVKSDNRAENLEWVSHKKHMAEYHPDRNKGRKKSEEHKQKLRLARLGTKQSEETKQKKREIALRLCSVPPPRPLGFKVSEETILKLREISKTAVACRVFGVVYRSFSEAGRYLNERPLSLRKRCLSPAFPDYEVL